MLTLNLCCWGPRYPFREGAAWEGDFVGETLTLFLQESLRQTGREDLLARVGAGPGLCLL